MKKQLLLGFLPALLVLSACNGGGQVKEKYDDLLEDTLAHEEIFDQQEQGLAPRRLLGPNVGGLRFEDPTPQTEKEEIELHISVFNQSFQAIQSRLDLLRLFNLLMNNVDLQLQLGPEQFLKLMEQLIQKIQLIQHQLVQQESDYNV